MQGHCWTVEHSDTQIDINKHIKCGVCNVDIDRKKANVRASEQTNEGKRAVNENKIVSFLGRCCWHVRGYHLHLIETESERGCENFNDKNGKKR